MNLKICEIGRESFAAAGAAKSTLAGKRMMPSHLEGSILGSAVRSVHQQYIGSRCSSEYFKSKATQTDYRESECQTLPWEPPYRVADGHDPEVLTLLSFTWGDGLPAGMHEVEIINRMRMRRAWEKILPPMDTPCNIKKRTAIISALEAEEWSFREAEIQAVMDLRLELAEKLMKEKEIEKKQKTEIRLKNLDEMLRKRRQKESKNIANRLSRELRKLSKRRRRGNKLDSIKEKEYRVQTRPRYDGCKIKELRENRREDKLFELDPEREPKRPKWLTNQLNYATQRRDEIRICSKFVERNERYMLRSCRRDEDGEDYLRFASGPCRLLKRREKLPSMPSTPRLSWLSENTEDRIDAAVEYLQDLVSGRAVQTEFLEGKNRCIELIEELQASQKLVESDDAIEELAAKMRKQEEEERKVARENKAKEMLEAIEGKTIAKMLAFLNDELTRLEGEKKKHALILLAERERLEKKIERAGQEQLEMNRRRELDEMYRQILKVNQECAQTYLEDIVKEGIEWASEREAEKYVRDLACKIDAMAKYMDENMDKIDEEGMVADMVYNFVLPQVAKELAERVKEEETKEEDSYLRAAHTSIYDETLAIAENEVLFAATDNGETTISSTEADVDTYESVGEYDAVDANVEIKEEISDMLPRVIELILDYTTLADEGRKQEIYIILEEMLGLAKKKLAILN